MCSAIFPVGGQVWGGERANTEPSANRPKWTAGQVQEERGTTWMCLTHSLFHQIFYEFLFTVCALYTWLLGFRGLQPQLHPLKIAELSGLHLSNADESSNFLDSFSLVNSNSADKY